MSHNGFLFKLKSIGVGDSVLLIYREFLSHRRQRVVVDGASRSIPIVLCLVSQSFCGVLCLVSLGKLVWLGYQLACIIRLPSESLWTPPCYCVVLPILECCSPERGSAADCNLQLFESQVCSVARLCPDHSFSSLCRHHVAGLCMLRKVNSISHHRLFSELSSASTRVRQTQADDAAHPLKFQVSRCRTSKFVGCFLLHKFVCGMTLSTLCLTPEHWMGLRNPVNRWLLLRGVFFSSCGTASQVLVGLWKEFRKNIFFPLGPVLQVLLLIIIIYFTILLYNIYYFILQ